MEDTFLPENTDLSVEESHPLASAHQATISTGSDAGDLDIRWLNNVRDFILEQKKSNLAHRQLARYCNEIRAKNPELAKQLPTLAEPVPFRDEDAIQTFERWLEELFKLNRAIERGNIDYIRNHAFRNGARLIRYFRALVRESDDSQFTSGLKADRLELIWKIEDGVARCKQEYQTLIGELESIELRIAQSLRDGNRDMTAHSQAIARAMNAYGFVLSDTLAEVMDVEMQRIEKRRRFFEGTIKGKMACRDAFLQLIDAIDENSSPQDVQEVLIQNQIFRPLAKQLGKQRQETQERENQLRDAFTKALQRFKQYETLHADKELYKTRDIIKAVKLKTGREMKTKDVTYHLEILAERGPIKKKAANKQWSLLDTEFDMVVSYLVKLPQSQQAKKNQESLIII